jgi:hypothetical protein
MKKAIRSFPDRLMRPVMMVDTKNPIKAGRMGRGRKFLSSACKGFHMKLNIFVKKSMDMPAMIVAGNSLKKVHRVRFATSFVVTFALCDANRSAMVDMRSTCERNVKRVSPSMFGLKKWHKNTKIGKRR